MPHAVVIVLGDLGRSPRMQYHANSLAQLCPPFARVTAIGYEGEDIMVRPTHGRKAALLVEKRFAPWDFSLLRRIAVLHAAFKGLGLLLQLFSILASLKRYDVIIIQNPPCLPALLAATVMSALNGSIVVIDWHNLGFAMFEEKHGSRHLLVRVARFLERFMSARAHRHICVSQAMQAWLRDHFEVQATVLYDRPSRLFKSAAQDAPSLLQRHQLFLRLGFTDANLFGTLSMPSSAKSEVWTCQTSSSSHEGGTEEETVCERRTDAAKLIVSATSWTPDEDFTVLLEALQALDAQLVDLTESDCQQQKRRQEPHTTNGGRRVLVVVTGKGPLKASFEDQVGRCRLRRVAVRTAWLSATDYALLMSCADVGVCLHTSTSGLDLPMKVLDMFGSGLPVCAIRFPTLPELVRHGENGLIFQSASELKEQLLTLLFDEGHDATLAALRLSAGEIGSWDDNWNAVMKPVVLDCLELQRRGAKRDKVVIFVVVLASIVALLFMEIFNYWILKPILRLGL